MAETKSKNIYEKLDEIFKEADVIQKTKQGFGYKYVPEDEILAKITAIMEQQRIQLFPRIVPQTLKAVEQNYKKVKKTNKESMIEEPVHETLVTADMVFEWIDLDNPESRIEVPWVLIASQNDPAQAFGSALSYCIRYFYLKFFHIATVDDDVDFWRSKQQEVTAKQTEEALSEIIKEIHEKVSTYVNKDKEKSEVMSAFLKSKNNGNANYLKITDIDVAKMVLSELKNFMAEKKEE